MFGYRFIVSDSSKLCPLRSQGISKLFSSPKTIALKYSRLLPIVIGLLPIVIGKM
jgi:hypothetical protein